MPVAETVPYRSNTKIQSAKSPEEKEYFRKQILQSRKQVNYISNFYPPHFIVGIWQGRPDSYLLIGTSFIVNSCKL